MLKLQNVLWIFFVFSGISFADSKEKKEGYGYTLKKYFSGRKKTPSRRRDMVLYVGSSLYSNSAARNFKHRPFSSFIVGFRQPLFEVTGIGDLNLKTEVQNFRLKTGQATQINFTPTFSLPEARSGFPIYVGVGLGFGFYPHFILIDKFSLSLNTPFFAGVRLINLYENLGLNGELALNMHFPFREKKLYMETIVSLGLLFSF